MKKLFFAMAVSLCLTTVVKAQDRMVVVTTSGQMYDFAMTEDGGLRYDAASGGYTIVSEGTSRTFGADEIKQVYFEDQVVVAADPYIEPKATDTVNPNFESLEQADYEVIELDTALCRIKVRFLKDVPQLYVGKILPFEKDDFGCNCYVLTWTLDGNVADIRFRPTPLEELLYNADLVFTSNPNDPYYKTGESVRTRGDNGDMKSLPPLEFVSDKISFGEEPVWVETGNKVTLQAHFAYQSGPPVQGSEGIRSYSSQIKKMGLVLTGTLENSLVNKIDIKAKKKVLDKEARMKKPLFYTAKGFVVGYVPIYVSFSAELGARMQAFAEAELRYAHENVTTLKVSAGMEYYGEKNELKPILDFTYGHDQKRPDFFALSGKGNFKASPFIRFDLAVNLAVGLHVDLMPFLRLNYESYVTKDGFFPYFMADAGVNLRGGLYFPLIRNGKDTLSYESPDLFVTKLWEEPKHFTVRDSLKRVFNSFGSHSEWEMQVQAEQDGEKQVAPANSNGAALHCQWMSDFPLEDKTEEYTLAGQYGGLSRPKVARRADGAGGLRPIGEPWAAVGDKDGNVKVACTSPVPMGYKTVLRTSIVDSLGNAVESHDIEMPWEVRNFNATYDFAGMTGTVEYRDGGKRIKEVNPLLGIAEYDNGKTTIHDVAGNVYTVTGEEASIAFLGCNCMWVTPMGLDQAPSAGLDEIRWAMAQGLIKNTQMTFGETNYLGYKCITCTVENGMDTIFQNVCLKADTGEGSFVVTKFEVLE